MALSVLQAEEAATKIKKSQLFLDVWSETF